MSLRERIVDGVYSKSITVKASTSKGAAQTTTGTDLVIPFSFKPRAFIKGKETEKDYEFYLTGADLDARSRCRKDDDRVIKPKMSAEQKAANKVARSDAKAKADKSLAATANLSDTQMAAFGALSAEQLSKLLGS